MKEGKPPASKGEPPVRWFSIFGFVIVTKADLLAASAFILSLGTLLYQLSIWVQGPRPKVYAPETVYIFFDQYANNRTVTRFAGQLTFLNVAAPNHDTVVERVDLTAAVGKKAITLPWLNVVMPRRDGTSLTIDPKDSAYPFILQSGGAVTHMYSFAPQEAPCPNNQRCNAEANFVDDVAFLKMLGEGEAIELTFTIQYVGRADKQTVGCRVPISPGLLTYLAENSWFIARCIEKAQNS